MAQIQDRRSLLEPIRKSLADEEDILFAYLFGSAARDEALPQRDTDIAVYLVPSSTEQYLKREAQLTAALISQLRNTEIDLRILNVLPLVFQYTVLKEGILILCRDELQRADFETGVMIRFFELKPYLDEYRRMLVQRIRGV